MISDGQVAIVCGTGINAHTLVRNLLRLGWKGPLILLRDQSENPGLAGLLNPGVSQWAVELRNPEDLPGEIHARFGSAERVAVLFTDERYHPGFASWRKMYPSTVLKFHLGAVARMDCVLDRYDFCIFVADRGLAAIPRTISGEEDPLKVFGEAFIVRPRFSWFGVAQRERVKLVRDPSQFDFALADYASRGLCRADLCFQELLSIRNEDNVSVCGWYGTTVRHLYCSRKVLQYPPGVGGGDLVELIPPPKGVMEQARAILAALSYEGPFEMEFVFDTISDQFKVTEVNPRFWLQHGLVEEVTGCALVSTYLECSPLASSEAETTVRFWVNPLYSVYRAFKLDFSSLRCWMSRRSWAPFGWLDAVHFGWWYVLERATGRQR
ncbi:hypothetical protein [Thiocapsa rosea]|uniref:Carbamoyl-phosphate synthase L subunit-like protein n=1 Tax=Thiocapsa rosea TaxID=69360 RepID=A0A495VAU8_9GAMM|nr:hypothetical protein [Thiocapsa rosea]RKT45575.1 carbamoyl-phosphate synthase L subunit-like protein [Thiocapsa rosea]